MAVVGSSGRQPGTGSPSGWRFDVARPIGHLSAWRARLAEEEETRAWRGEAPEGEGRDQRRGARRSVAGDDDHRSGPVGEPGDDP